MTETFNELDADSLGVDKIARSATAYALYNNAIAIAQRGTNAPWLNGVGAMEVLTSGTSWTVPDGVTRVRAILIAGGGGGGGRTTAGANGGNTTFGSLTANGGVGGGSGNGGVDGADGTGTGTGLIISGSSVDTSYFGKGSTTYGTRTGAGGIGASYWDSQPSYQAGDGGDGAIVIGIITVTPGGSVSMTIGTGGAAGTGSVVNPATAGKDGIIILEY